VTTFSSGGTNNPTGLAFANGSFHVANSGSDSISRVGGGTASFFAGGGGLSFPMGLAADADGNLYAANFGAYSISKVTPSGNVSFFANTDGGPAALAFAHPSGANPPPLPVPEPGTAALALVGALVGVARRPRKTRA
jgi:hypothetical protein